MPIFILSMILLVILVIAIFMLIIAIQDSKTIIPSLLFFAISGLFVFWVCAAWSHVDIDYTMYQKIKIVDGKPFVTVDGDTYNAVIIFKKNIPLNAIIKTDVREHWSWGIRFHSSTQASWTYDDYSIIEKGTPEYDNAVKKAKE